MTALGAEADSSAGDVDPVILMTACADLCELLDIENDALAHQDPETVAALLDRKEALTGSYADAVRRLAVGAPAVADRFSPDQRTALLGVARQLDTLIERNAILLQAAIEAARIALEVIASSAREAQDNDPAKVYNRAGTLSGSEDKGGRRSFDNLL